LSTVTRHIRPARESDIPFILTILEAARSIMRSSGNPNQWKPGYPTEEMILKDIAGEHGQVMEEDHRLVAYFAFIPSPEPTYAVIEGGSWLDDRLPYHVIHRIASFPNVHGVFRSIMDWSFARESNIRVDTHRDNKIMQHCLLSYGFQYCGIIYLLNGDERLAFQKL